MWEIGAFVVATVVLPVLINKSTESGRFDWIKPRLRQIWTAIFAFFSLYLLQKPAAMEVAMKLHTRLPGPLGYVVAAICGALLLCGYWWFTGVEFNKAPAVENTTRQQITAPALQPNESKSFPPRKLPPLIKQGAVSTLIPFNKDGMSAGIPYEKNTQDPLMMTYITLAGIGRMPTRYAAGAGFTPVSDNEAASFTSDVLRYYILRSIVELQSKETFFSYQSERGMTTTTTSPVAVPEAQPYPKDQLDNLLTETKFGLDQGEQLRIWKHHKLEVPAGTIISLGDRAISLKKEGYYTLRFWIDPAGRNIGVLPVNFIPAEKLDRRNIVGFVFTVSMRFEWYRDYAEAEPYKEWAQSLAQSLF